MIPVTLLGSLAFAALLACATFVGVTIARRLPFGSPFRTRLFVTAFGAALAPLLLGLLAVFALALLPGVAPGIHLGVVVVTLLAAGFALRRFAPPTSTTFEIGPLERLLIGGLVAYVLVLVLDATTIPLVQSDALEYATAARRLYSIRTLSAYPPLDPVNDPSGFYGPWTHPPLYTALLYLADVSQGNAGTPGLLRLVSVWALLACAMLVAAIGATARPRAGLFAALFLVATPSLFLGADAAAIDPLTVLGVALALAACIAIPGVRSAENVVVGLMVGLAMWTHSQALLLLPVSLFVVVALGANGGDRMLVLLKRCALIAITSLAVAAWPYLANLARSGVLIGDNPPVYALSELNWRDYFRSERSIASPAQRLQYGILKGWTTPESFALTFWFMTLGIGTLLVARRRDRAAHWWSGPGRRVVIAALAFLACYYAGVVASTIAGVDIMIRNERYFLFVMPAVALLASVGVDELTTAWLRGRSGTLPRAARVIATTLVIVMFAAELPVLFAYRVRRAGLSPSQIFQPLERKLTSWEPYLAIQTIQRNADSGTTLSFKPSDMFYSGRKMVSFLDPRLMDVYRESDPARAARMLRALGVSLIHVPGYASPTLYNSALSKLLADPGLARLEFSHAGYQVYRLVDGTPFRERLCDARQIGPRDRAWQWTSGFVLGGAKQFATFRGAGGALTDSVAPVARVAAFQRERHTVLASPPVPVSGKAEHERTAELALSIDVTGSGFAHFFVEQLNARGVVLGRDEMSGVFLAPGQTRTHVRRFVARPDAAAIRASVNYDGGSTIGVSGATLSAVCRLDRQ